MLKPCFIIQLCQVLESQVCRKSGSQHHIKLYIEFDFRFPQSKLYPGCADSARVGLQVATCNFALAGSGFVGLTRSCTTSKFSSLTCVFDLFFTCNFMCDWPAQTQQPKVNPCQQINVGFSDTRSKILSLFKSQAVMSFCALSLSLCHKDRNIIRQRKE